ncbi:MAG: Rieske 2Fe-2S domain-containing protein [Rhodoferax sp.]|nr:Rieske 2Fe-2S domain-containing protein [Rhodoferax sp.]OIP24075.1 MAG: 2Fe-2S ferredoxin [Comamonadaceae bacterium CG2_30_60_41]PIW07701.1 MAG: 2Fe-2S ferredoxin [Comamonadaceae bacterium CG17_big_fil_post_rev_8_21_14_2_50_60_13]PIY23207.1 MAG: 2Fe-2S ferredoxin [Comamonadaceae bacterium CG_4_10_14_3_um_filter_60_75]PJC17001.1 MAG: 2Fe-2S ferredoxin [Comamonadaceae bacterium CG_4_9_14_0_8_um_filter_60_18]
MTAKPATVSELVYLCQSAELVDSGSAVPFEVRYFSRSCNAFAVRYGGKVYAYLNQCSHVPMEMDYQPNQFFDSTGHWLMCATHGAMYSPSTGHCRMGPCRGGLVPIATREADGVVHWHTSDKFQTVF